MKKLLFVLLAAGVLTAMGLLPFRAVDASKLLPVKTVIVTKAGEEYVVDIGSGVRAVGDTLRQALDRLREEVSGQVFLPTAEQVIITEPAEGAVEAVAEETEFRPAAGIYLTPEPSPDAEALGILNACSEADRVLHAYLSNGNLKDSTVFRSSFCVFR